MLQYEQFWKNKYCHKNLQLILGRVLMTNDNGNNETLVIYGLSVSVLKFPLQINSEKLKRRI